MLEYYYQISTLNDIRVKTMKARETCDEIMKEVEKMYGKIGDEI